MEAVWLALVVVFVAEFGDKTQLLAMAFAARARTSLVVAGLVVANVATQGLAALAGDVLGSLIDGPAVGLGAAALFAVFAVLALRDDDDEDGEVTGEVTGGGLRVVAVVAATVFLAEVGDKTMLATLTLAARDGFVPVWVGSAIGMTLAGLVGVAAGRLLGQRLPERALRWGTAAMFLLVGAWIAYDALAG